MEPCGHRVGDDKPIKVDVRVVAATNRDLRDEVKAGRFRQDLLFRLNVFPIGLPPLRERTGDIPLLAEHFVAQFNHLRGKRVLGLTLEALRALEQYEFRGNVRELANFVERAFALADPDALVRAATARARLQRQLIGALDRREAATTA